ncbi:hypothetical protein V9T40_010189 [Parthenolecanium corni]|uniref:Uncharacterized protein n=1 Tax=Parthenolecanium corni TaxID=536013 RepID=A0AAN9TLF3_9HEMI
MNGVNHILGRGLSKSTSRLAADSNQRSKKVNIDYTNRGVQTLPRKSKKQVFINDPSSDQENHHSRRLNHQNSNSMINVSMVNNTSRTPSFKHTISELSASPQKPARTYRTSLLRSKSFNVQLGPQHHDRNAFIKSNPQLHKLDKLDESPPPLKSPGIVTSISRSTRDLSKMDDDFRPASSFEHRDFAKTNGYTTASSFDSATSRRPFLRGLKTRTPELYKTLHEDDELDSPTSRLTSTPLRSGGRNKLLDYSSSFHSGTTANPASATRKPTVSFESDLRSSPASSFLNKGYSTLSRISPEKNGDIVDKSVKRSGSNDDYSETVRITSKSTDPLRPSVTNTVQSFSKKTVPSKDGRLETIESSETTRVTKSHYRGDGENDKLSSRYKPKNGSVIIEVRNERK